MQHDAWGALIAALGMVVTGGFTAHAAEAAITLPAGSSIAVRTYTQPDSERNMRTARRIASAALSRAGIQVTWAECGLPAAVAQVSKDACTHPLRANELMVRVVSTGPTGGSADAEALGFAFVDLDSGGGWLATVYANRVEELARRAGVDAAELLGRAMAHEIGHLLLGTNQHARHGLMRASWSGADLRRDRATQWLFGGNEAAAMRRTIARRVTP